MQSPSSSNDTIIRHGEFEDLRPFTSLLSNSGGDSLYKAVFGQFNFSNLIELNFLSLVSQARDDKETLYSFVSLNDSSLSVTTDDDFGEQFHLLQQFIPITPVNSLFLNFWAVDERIKSTEQISKDLFRQCFETCPFVDFIVWLCPSKAVIPDYANKVFSLFDEDQLAQNGALKQFKGKKLLFIHRSNFLPKLLVREARVEDTDDLIPILKENSPQVLEGQDDFFLVDLIQSQDERNRFFVGIAGNETVGMLATSLDVNVSLITKIFDIDAFPGLVIEKEEVQLPPPIVISVMGDIRLIDSRVMSGIANKYGCIFVDLEEYTYKINDEAMKEDKQNSIESNVVQYTSVEVVTKLSVHIAALLEKKKLDGEAPLACILYGFPRTEEDVGAIQSLSFNINVTIEIQNVSEDIDIDETDDFFNFHLDGVELFRKEIISVDDATSTNLSFPDDGRLKTLWKKILVDNAVQGVTETTKKLADEVRGVVEMRAKEIESIQSQHMEEAAKANAFAVTVFCMDSAALSRSEDILRVSFEDHPHLEYCLYMVPCSATPNNLTRSFVRLDVKSGISFDQTLFIMHRDALLAPDFISTKRLNAAVVPALTKFLAPLRPEDQAEVLHFCQGAIRENDVDLKDNPGEVSLTVSIGDSVVGVVNISRKHANIEDIQFLRANFELDEHVNYEKHRPRAQAVIVHWVLSPIYSRWGRFILREVMRLYHKTLLYYQCSNNNLAPLEIAEELVSVLPRRRAQQVAGQDPQPFLKSKEEGLNTKSLTYFIAKRNLVRPKTACLSRIVVAGGCTASISLIKSICFHSKYSFPHLTIIMDNPPIPLSMKGNDSKKDESKFSDDYSGCLSPSSVDDFSENELFALGLAHKCSLVRGRLTDIDRANRAVVVSDEAVVEYDLLLISGNTQDCSAKKFAASSNMHPQLCAHRGIFGLGNPKMDEAALKWVRSHGGSIAVFGAGLEAYNVVGRLLKFGVSPDRIQLIISDNSLLKKANPSLSRLILEALNKTGVTVFSDFDVVDVIMSQNRHIDGALIRQTNTRGDSGSGEAYASSQPINIDCSSLLCCNIKSCDFDTFSAINDSGLVYDGGVVVDKNFRTVDHSIFAFGGFTKFSRIYTDSIAHSRFNPRELGTYVAKHVLDSHLIPSLSFSLSQARASSKFDYELPQFSNPRSFVFDLPGGLRLFQSYLPELSPDLTPMVTGETDDVDLCVAEVDNFGILCQLSILGTSRLEDRNFSQLVGWHEAYLNGMVCSFDQGLVNSWISYFRESWATPLYHDKFSNLARVLMASLSNDKGVFTILDRIFEIADNNSDDQIVQAGRRKLLGDRCERLPETTLKTIENHVLDFVRANKSTLTNIITAS